jgi:hypothetical protein
VQGGYQGGTESLPLYPPLTGLVTSDIITNRRDSTISLYNFITFPHFNDSYILVII